MRTGWSIVTGGGGTGLLAQIGEETKLAEGHITGVVPGELFTVTEGGTGFLSHLHTVPPSLAVRKTRMVELADAIIALPGGYGTFDELFTVLAEFQTGASSPKALCLVNIDGFFDRMLGALEEIAAAGFAAPQHLKLYQVAHSPLSAVLAIEATTRDLRLRDPNWGCATLALLPGRESQWHCISREALRLD